MWNGWNQPPDEFSIVQISTSPFFGLASTFLNPLFSTASQVVPLIVHLLFDRTSLIERVATACEALRFITACFVLSTAGTGPSADASVVSTASPTTSNAMILFVFV